MRRGILKKISNLTQITWPVRGEDMEFEPTLLDLRSPSIYYPNTLLSKHLKEGLYSLTKRIEWKQWVSSFCNNASKLVSPCGWFLLKHQDFLRYLHGFFLFPPLEFSCSDFFFFSYLCRGSLVETHQQRAVMWNNFFHYPRLAIH